MIGQPGAAMINAYCVTLGYTRQPDLRRHVSNSWIALRAKSHMFASRSALPVSTVITASTGPETAMQAGPAGSPYRLPLGPVAPVSLKPQVAPRLARTR